MSRTINEAGTLEPLEDEGQGEERKLSDHRVAFCGFKLARRENFTWQSYHYRHYNEKSVNDFKEWIVMHDWAEVFSRTTSNEMTNAYQATVVGAIERFFPLKTTRRKSTDLPWMTKGIQKMIKNRKKLYVREGGERTDTWRAEKNELKRSS